VTAPPKVRLLTLAFVLLPAILALSLYVSTRDWAHLARQYQLGHTPTLPPRAKPGPKPEALGAAQHTAVAVFQVLRLVTIGALLLAVVADSSMVSSSM